MFKINEHTIVHFFTAHFKFVSICIDDKMYNYVSDHMLTLFLFLTFPPDTLHVYTNKASYFDQHFIKEIVQLYNRKYMYQFHIVFYDLHSMDKAFQIVNTGEKDHTLVINSITITEERKQHVDFSLPYFPMKQAFITHPSRKIKPQNTSALHYTLGAVENTIHVETAKRIAQRTKQTLVIIPENEYMPNVIVQGRVDLYIADSIEAWVSEDRILISHIDDAPLTHYGIMYPKGSLLVEMFNPFIRYFIRSRRYHELVRTYLKSVPQNYFESIREFE